MDIVHHYTIILSSSTTLNILFIKIIAGTKFQKNGTTTTKNEWTIRIVREKIEYIENESYAALAGNFFFE